MAKSPALFDPDEYRVLVKEAVVVAKNHLAEFVGLGYYIEGQLAKIPGPRFDREAAWLVGTHLVAITDIVANGKIVADAVAEPPRIDSKNLKAARNDEAFQSFLGAMLAKKRCAKGRARRTI